MPYAHFEEGGRISLHAGALGVLRNLRDAKIKDAKVNNYKVPSSWAARELLREKGQFWTPDWIAEPMVEYALAGKDGVLFDPAVGTGAFFRAAKAVAARRKLAVSLVGLEIDPATLSRAWEHGLTKEDVASVTVGDFVLEPPRTRFSAIVANPPYIRHHRLSPEGKAQLRQRP